jgi:subtilisin family serine protease
MVDETSNLWFIEFRSKPAVQGTSLATIAREQSNFRAAVAMAGIPMTERYAFSMLWNGISVEMNAVDAARASRLGGVTSVYPVEVVSMPDGDPSPDLASALAMTGADIAQSELGFTGAGVKVAVMDTGIDYDHPDLGGCFGPGCRVAYGYDLVGDDFSAGVNDTLVPDPDPDDCGGHGTHVAGIVGANGTVVGVAPDVTFGAYRVFGCSGSTYADIMIQAMEMALMDGMDILNMSIGSSFAWPNYPTAVASNNMVMSGMVVVASIGNSGASGLYSAGAPGVGKEVIGVASFENEGITVPFFQVNGEDVGYITMTFSPDPPTSGTEEIVYVGRACNVDLPLLEDPTGKVALINRGACSFAEKAINAEAAGATAVVIHNSSPGLFNGTLGSPVATVPVVGISLDDGLFIRAQAAPIMMTWMDGLTQEANPLGGLIASSSSYGLAADLSIKPDIGAPGAGIYSTYPLESGGYATLSGTSMASPHVAGAAALYLQAHPQTPAVGMRSLLQNSADPHLWWGNPALGFLDNVHRQGAGMLDIDDAILAMTHITPGKLSVGEGEAGPKTFPLTLHNIGKYAVTYSLDFVNALSTGGTITPSFWDSDAMVSFDMSEVTVPAQGYATVNATIYPATYPDFGQYGGYITFTPDDGGQMYSVPFAGFVGDYQGITVLEPTANGFPWLARLVGGSYFFEDEGAVFTMTDGDIPYFLVHLEHQSRRFRMEIYNANTGLPLGRLDDVSYVSRNSSPTSFFSWSFDGMISNPNKTYELPDGHYFVKIRVLKALGNAANPEHWEIWDSPNFFIDRP